MKIEKKFFDENRKEIRISGHFALPRAKIPVLRPYLHPAGLGMLNVGESSDFMILKHELFTTVKCNDPKGVCRLRPTL